MIILPDEHIETVKQILKSQLSDQHYKIIIFGSRANGNPNNYSDIDIAIIGQQCVPIKSLLKLSEI